MVKIVPDTSIIIDQQVSVLVQDLYKGAEVLIPEAVPSEIENHANKRKEIGYQGLEELKKLQQLSTEGIITLEYVGRRPKLDEISIAGGGEIDAMIRDIARKYHTSIEEICTLNGLKENQEPSPGTPLLVVKKVEGQIK